MALRRAAIAFLFTVLSVPIAFAQTAADFYRGKSVDLYINGSVGGGYDLYGRMVARHIGKHIPGHPTVLPKNMEGGGGLRLSNWLYNIGPKDGTAIGAVTRAMAFEPLLGGLGEVHHQRHVRQIGVLAERVLHQQADLVVVDP